MSFCSYTNSFCVYFIFFFFSSRRRHTRCSRDWSSDVCSSDLGIWWAIAGDGSVAGYARADFARYFFAVMLINQLTIAWDSWYLDRWIREGELNYRLARPLHPAHEAVAENIAYKARTASVILVVWLLVAAAGPAVRLPLDPGRRAITAVAAGLAAAMRFF